MIKIFKRIYWRLNAILGYIILLPIDFMVYLTTSKSWFIVHGKSLKVVKECWYKY